MRKTERLDQILVRLGHCTQDQIEAAVARQREEGGRIGKNLIDLGALNEEQLFDGLVEQFRLPTVTVDESVLDPGLIERVPASVLRKGLIVPIAWNEELRVLSIAAANPSDEDGIRQVGEAFRARKVRVSLAPENILAALLRRVGASDPAEAPESDGVRLVALPELFEPQSDEPDVPAAPEGHAEEARRVVMITEGAVRKNFLPTVLGAEGIALSVVGRAEELREALAGDVEALLVEDDLETEVRDWFDSGAAPRPECEITVFRSIGSALLDNPAPYPTLAASVRRSVQALAEYRALREGVTAPYGRMGGDLDAVASRLGLPRLACDGLVLGAHLLLPVERGTRIDPFRSFGESIDLARRLRFPWPVDRLLSTCLELYLGRAQPGPEGGSRTDDVLLCAELLALVWFRHNLVERPSEEDVAAAEDGERTDLRAQLRALAGRFASLDVVETYLDEIERRGGGETEGLRRRILALAGEEQARPITSALGRAGCDVEALSSEAEILAHLESDGADAVVIDHTTVGDALEHACTALRVDRSALVFVLTAESDPALVLNLLDLGVRDVFGPPHEYDLIAARIVRAVRDRATGPVAGGSEGQFSAKLEAFSFLDLSQMLANGRKSVRVDLHRGDEQAVLYMAGGRPTFASCGALAGPEAVYRIIAWDDEGQFTVDDADDFPEPNLEESMESLLMEGVRLLDESRA